MLPQFRKPEGEGSKIQPTGGLPAQPSLSPSPSLGVRQSAQPFRSSGTTASTSIIGPDLVIQGNLDVEG